MIRGNVTEVGEVIQYSSGSLLEKEIAAVTTLVKGESLVFEEHQFFLVNVDLLS